MKSFTAMLLAVLMIFALTACGGTATTSDPAANAPAADEFEPIVLKLSHTRAEDSADHQMAVWFKEQVEEKTGGKIKIDIYSNNSLGD